MMARKLLLLKHFVLGFFIAGLLAMAPESLSPVPGIGAGPAIAQDEAKPKRKTRRTPAMRLKFHEELQEAQLEVEAGNVAGGLEMLIDLQDFRGINAYERAMLFNSLAYVYYSEENYKQAIDAYQTVLAQPELPYSVENATLYALAQLYFVTEDYDNSIGFLLRWFEWAENPGPTPYIFLGQAYYQQGEYEKGIDPIVRAIEIATVQGRPVRENWYLLLRSMYYELKNMPKVMEILELLVVKYPKAEYWIQLGGVYGELGQEEEQLAVMDVAYRKGYLTSERHYTNLAQLYLYHRSPILAAKIMQKGLDNEIIEATERNYETYAQALINAREFEDALEPLGKAAELSEDGELFIRKAQVHVERDEWTDCIENISDGIEKGDLNRNDTAHVLLGMCYYNADNLSQARKQFVEARKDKRSAKMAQQWITFLDKEKKRRDELRRAELQ